jgi:hypothetical protein
VPTGVPPVADVYQLTVPADGVASSNAVVPEQMVTGVEVISVGNASTVAVTGVRLADRQPLLSASA